MSTETAEPAPIDVLNDYPELRESQLFTEYINRVRNNRDMHVLFTGEGETGVGKTTAAVSLCLLLDFNGFTAENAKYSVPDFNTGYFDVPAGSWLLADDVQKWMDSRESMRKEQRENTTDIQANRIRQVMVAWTAPSKNWLDKRLGSDIVDYWVQCLEGQAGEPAGKARVYRLNTEEHSNNEYKDKTEILSWPILDGHPVFEQIQQKKLLWLQGELDEKYVTKEEFEDMKSNFWNKSKKKTRYEMLRGVHDLLEERGLLGRGGITQGDLGAAIGKYNDDLALSQQMVSEIVGSDSFESFYSNQ